MESKAGLIVAGIQADIDRISTHKNTIVTEGVWTWKSYNTEGEQPSLTIEIADSGAWAVTAVTEAIKTIYDRNPQGVITLSAIPNGSTSKESPFKEVAFDPSNPGEANLAHLNRLYSTTALPALCTVK